MSVHLWAQETGGERYETEWDGTLRRIRVPILMYHYVGELPEDADDIRIDLTLNTAIFRRHLEYLRDNGYITITLQELYQALTTGAPLPAKPIVLSFDDGHRDHYTNVFPLLKEFGFTGTFFVITALADTNNQHHLSWQQIQEMAEAGMSMEAHTKSHVSLLKRDHEFLVYQIMGSVESLVHFTDQEPTILSYPGGQYDNGVLEFLDTTSLNIAVTTRTGSYHTTDSRFELPRLRIHNTTGVSGLIYLLNLPQ